MQVASGLRPASPQQRAISQTAVSQTAAALLQLCSLGRAREVDVSSADKRQPCWLACRGDGYAVLQPVLRDLEPFHLGHASQAPLLPEVAKSLPPAPPPGLSVSPLGCSQPGDGAVVQSGNPDADQSQRSPVSAATSPQLTCTLCTATSAKVVWVMDARKLMSKDRMLVSPAFELPMGRPVKFRMMLQPKDTPGKSGGGSFEKSRGRGHIQLKCEGDLAEEAALSFKLAAGKAAWRGPVRHDFAESSVACLPAGRCDWNLRSATDAASQTVTISLEVECA